MNPLSILPNLKKDLERVEIRLTEETVAEEELLTEVANHLIPAGGKRIRPGFTITAACLGDTPTQSEATKTQTAEPKSVSDDVIAGAVAVELVHLGSLYHDDVMDGAKKRRNIESVNSRYGDHTAILAGDFLLAKSSILAANLGTEVSRLLAVTIAHLCEGQILEHRDIGNLKRTPEDYMNTIEKKTASLLSTACQIGAIVSNNDCANYLREFGLAYGMAFQVIDDISDLLTDGSAMGKPGGNDITEGNYTLPVLYALAEGNKELWSVLGKGDLKSEEIARAQELTAASPGLEKAVNRARDFTTKAQNALGDLPDNLSSQAYGMALEHLTNRLEALL